MNEAANVLATCLSNLLRGIILYLCTKRFLIRERQQVQVNKFRQDWVQCWSQSVGRPHVSRDTVVGRPK